MESLVSLGDSLPASNLVNAEKDLLASFKAAALSITTLYRSSRHTSKRAFNAGYTAACKDLLLMIQHGVSTAGTTDGATMDVGRVMDWVDARLAAIRAREEEEDEDEERERSGPKSSTTHSVPSRKRPSPPPPPSSPPVAPSAPPPAPAASTSARSVAPLPAPKPTKGRVHSRFSPSIAFPPVPVHAEPPPLALGDIPIGIGQKRRHALVALSEIPAPSSPSSALSSPAPSASPASALARRRTRSAAKGGLSLAPSLAQNRIGGAESGPSGQAEMMDVEEDGRERKRVARR